MPQPVLQQGVTNSEFLRHLAAAAPKGSVLWVSAFVGNPGLANGWDWAGAPYNAATMSATVDSWSQQNTYFSVGCLRYDVQGEVARRKTHFERLLALVADDVTPADMQGSPTWVLQTSPGKHQVGVMLDGNDPDCANKALCTRLVNAMAERGMLKADPSGNNVVRYVRLPVGQNQKPRESGAWAHVVEAWAPNARYTLADAAGILGIDLDSLRSEAAKPAMEVRSSTQDEHIAALSANIIKGEGRHDSIAKLASSLAGCGMPGGAIVNMLRGLMSASLAPRNEKWQALYKDIPRAVSSAQAKFAPAVDLAAFRASVVVASTDQDVAEAEPETLAPTVSVPSHLLTVPGMLGEAVDYINATARKPQPLFAVQAALALGSTVMGRRYCTDNGNWPSLYFLNVGPSGAGKEHAKYAVEKLLETANLGNLIGVGRFASESSVISSLIEKPAQFSCLDEFGKFMQAAAVSNNFADRNTLKALMETWGRCDGTLRPVAYSTAGMSSKQAEELSNRMVRNPALTLLAMTTPDTLFSGLTSTSVADGLLNRLITVYSDRGRQSARMVPRIDAPQSLLDWMVAVHTATVGGNLTGAVAHSHDLAPSPIVLPIDAGAARVFDEMERGCNKLADGLEKSGLHEMVQRATETAMRLSVIVAGSNGHAAIHKGDAEWARDYVLWHIERNLEQLRDKLSDGDFDRLVKDMTRLIERAGKRGMTEAELDSASRAFRSANLRTRDDAFKVLLRRQVAVFVVAPQKAGPGRKRGDYWVAAEHVGAIS